MKNKLILRMYVILLITVLTILGGVSSIVYVISYNAMVDDIRSRANGVKDHILENLFVEDLVDIGEISPAGVRAGLLVQAIHEQLREVGNLSRLYIAKEDVRGEIVTTMRPLSGSDARYVPSGALEDDLRLSLRESAAVMGRGIYETDTGGVYTIFWPVMDSDHKLIGSIGMEFDVNSIYMSHRQAAVYSLALSGALLVLISIIAYLSMSRATEPFYKKLAYTDILTGHENRMAFEHRLRDCGPEAEEGINVTLIVCDINNLKTVNDTIGHEAGDAYIRNTTNLIHENLGGSIPVYRIGGDEIAAVIVGKKEKEIEGILEALRTEKRPTYKTFLFSCASGAASFIKGTDADLRDTFKRADEAMYEEKKRQKAALGQTAR